MLIIPGIIASSYPRASTAFESIATATGTGSSGTITFSSIPSTYKHLQLRAISKNLNTATAGRIVVYMTFNGDTATNYAYHRLYGDGSTVTAQGFANQTEIAMQDIGVTSESTLANILGAAVIDIADYANTSKNKTVKAFYGINANIASTTYTVSLHSGLWRSTSAINSITLTLSANSFTTSTQFALYGIKGA